MRHKDVVRALQRRAVSGREPLGKITHTWIKDPQRLFKSSLDPRALPRAPDPLPASVHAVSSPQLQVQLVTALPLSRGLCSDFPLVPLCAPGLKLTASAP